MSKQDLRTIRKIYEKGENVMQYLQNGKHPKNTDEAIMISYDLQSGSYIQFTEKNPELNEKYTRAIATVIDKFGTQDDTILEAGVGEATTLANLIPKLKTKLGKAYGFDLAWSRIRYAIAYMKKKGLEDSCLFMGDLFNIPLADNSIDIVYTSHTLEPNGGREREALVELIRVTKKYLVLLEPAYELAGEEAKKRMEKHGYIRNLYSTAISLGLNVIEHRLFDVCSNPLNPTGIMIIEKDPQNKNIVQNPFICPITKTPLEPVKDVFFTREGLLAYPIVDEVPCLLKDNGIIASHFTDDFERL